MKKNVAFCKRSIAVAIALSMVLSLTAVNSVTVWATSMNEVNENSEEKNTSIENIDENKSTESTEESLFDECEIQDDESDSSKDPTDPNENEEANTAEIYADTDNEETVKSKEFEEEGKEEIDYSNYRYGDPELTESITIGTDENGNDVLAIFINDLDEIIYMAESGMDLAIFFEGTVFGDYTLEDLYILKVEGISLLEMEELLTEDEWDKENNKYSNYSYGDSFYNGRYIYGTDENGNNIYYMYTKDIDEIIFMAEDGMDLSKFFEGTAFVGYDINALYDIQGAGLTIEKTYSWFDPNSDLLQGSTLNPLENFLNGEISDEQETP